MPNVSMGAFPGRRDLIDEIDIVFNSNGGFVSGWYDSSGINAIRIASYNIPGASVSFQVEEAQLSQNSADGSTQPVRIQTLAVDATGSVYAQLNLTGRFFLISVLNGTAGQPLRITIRAV